MQHQEASKILNYTVSFLTLEIKDIKYFKNVLGNHAISFLKQYHQIHHIFYIFIRRLVENMSGPIGCDPKKASWKAF